jgi:hypothetical protein
MQTRDLSSSNGTDPHIAWWHAACELVDKMNGRPDLADAEMNRAGELARRFHGLIAGAPATSRIALACQIQVALLAMRGETLAEHGEAALEQVLAAISAAPGGGLA